MNQLALEIVRIIWSFKIGYGTLDKYNIIPQLFPKKLGVCIRSVDVGNDSTLYMLSFTSYIDLLLKKYEYF